MNYYEQFIKRREIKKDINFYYNKIIDIIRNDIFSKFISDNRKKIHKIYELNDFLSQFNLTKLQFKNDKISVEFFVKNSDSNIQNLVTFRSFGNFSNYKLNDIDIVFNINLSRIEYENNIIYDRNDFFSCLRKNINIIHNTYIESLNRDEESKFELINKKLNHLKTSYHEIWNKFVLYLTDITDPNFDFTLNKFKLILNGIHSEKISTNFELMHNTNFYLKYYHLRQIKINKFMVNLKKVCLDDEEILYLTKNVAECFNHHVENYDESICFIEDVLEHFNYIYHTKEKEIDFLVSSNWNSIN